MSFGRGDLGRLFPEQDAPPASQSDAKHAYNIPKLPGVEAQPFRPTKDTERRVGRYWAGKAPEWVPGGGGVAVGGAEQGGAFDESRSASGASGARARQRFEAVVTTSSDASAAAPVDTTLHATEYPADAPRRKFEAAVLVSRADDSIGAVAADDAEGEEEAVERRRRLRERLAARRARSPSPAVEIETNARVPDLAERDHEPSPAASSSSSSAAAAAVSAPDSSAAASAPPTNDTEDELSRRERLKQRSRHLESASSTSPSSSDAAGSSESSSGVGSARIASASSSVSATNGVRSAVEAAILQAQADAAAKAARASADGQRASEGSGTRRNSSGAAVGLEKSIGAGHTAADDRPRNHTHDDNDDDGSSNEDDDDEDEDAGAPVSRKLYRPVFRTKAQRDTIREAEEKEAAEAAEAAARKSAKTAAQAASASSLVAESLASELAAEAAEGETGGDIVGKPDDVDRPEDEEAAFSAWQLRELQRVKSEAAVRAEAAEEAAETERRRKLSPEALAAEDAELARRGLKVFHKEKMKWSFLQKYWHKGSFYVDEDTIGKGGAAGASSSSSSAGAGSGGVVDVRVRRADEPTGDDKFDRSVLPTVMQVKNFGRRGRTKYTHLTAEDTTQFDDYHKPDSSLARKFESKMAGVHGGVGGGGGRGR